MRSVDAVVARVVVAVVVDAAMPVEPAVVSLVASAALPALAVM